MAATVDLIGLSKSFGNVHVLRDVTLSIKAGEFLTLLGPSGCGKSTLLRIISGLEVQDAGEVRIAGKDIGDLPPKQRNIAMVFQSYALYPYMTVAANIGLPLTMSRLSAVQRFPFLGRFIAGAGAERGRIASDVREMARSLAIEHLLERKPGQLSGGQKQRVALARAMVRHPVAFLMDEPLSNLDANLRAHMRGELTELHRRLGTTLIYVTHDQTEAMTMSDRVAVMSSGRLLQVGAPHAIYADPDSLEVAQFIGSPRINVLPARVRADGVELCGTVLRGVAGAVPGSELRLGIRPETIALGTRAAPGAIAATVRQIEHLGPEILVYAAVPGCDAPVAVRADASTFADFAVGQSVFLLIRSEAVMMFDASGARLRPTTTTQPAAVAYG